MNDREDWTHRTAGTRRRVPRWAKAVVLATSPLDRGSACRGRACRARRWSHQAGPGQPHVLLMGGYVGGAVVDWLTPRVPRALVSTWGLVGASSREPRKKGRSVGYSLVVPRLWSRERRLRHRIRSAGPSRVARWQRLRAALGMTSQVAENAVLNLLDRRCNAVHSSPWDFPA